MQETAVSLVPKEEVAFLREKEDKKFFDFITNELSKAISDKLIQVLETNDEIIIKKPVLRISEYGPLDSVEYKKIIDWAPLVRCKDCIHRPTDTGGHGDGFDIEFPDNICPCQVEDPYYSWVPKDDWFCPDGERREDNGRDKI